MLGLLKSGAFLTGSMPGVPGVPAAAAAVTPPAPPPGAPPPKSGGGGFGALEIWEVAEKKCIDIRIPTLSLIGMFFLLKNAFMSFFSYFPLLQCGFCWIRWLFSLRAQVVSRRFCPD